MCEHQKCGAVIALCATPPIVICCVLFVQGATSNGMKGSGMQDKLKQKFNLTSADCPVFEQIFKYCQVGAAREQRRGSVGGLGVRGELGEGGKRRRSGAGMTES